MANKKRIVTLSEDNFKNIIDFLINLTSRSYCNICECMTCEALKLLREIQYLMILILKNIKVIKNAN